MKNDQNESTAQDRAALRRLAKQENQRAEEACEQRIAELNEQLADIDRDFAAIAVEYKPRVDALTAKQLRLRDESVEAARQRDDLQIEMQGKQMQCRTRRTKLDAELRTLEGRIVPVPKFFERDDARVGREEFEKELTR